MADLPILDELRHELREAGRHTAPAPRRRSWRPAFAVAAAGLAAAFVIVVGPQGSGDPLTSSQEPPAGETLSHLVYREGRPGRLTHKVELWTTEDKCRARSIVEHPPGTPFGEFTQAPGETRSWNAKPNRTTIAKQSPLLLLSPFDPGAAARQYLRKHPSRIVDRTERNGRAMVWRQTRDRSITQRFLTDADSYEVWEIRTVRKGKDAYRLVIDTREEVPYDAKLLTMSVHPDADVERIRRPRPEGKVPRRSRPCV